MNNTIIKDFVKKNGKRFVSEKNGEVSYEYWLAEDRAIFYVEGNKAVSLYKSDEGLVVPSEQELSEIVSKITMKSVA